MHFTVHRQLFLVPDVSETVSSDAIISVFLLFSMTLRILSFFSFFFLLHMRLFSFNVSMLTVQNTNWQPAYLTGDTVAQSPVSRVLLLIWALVRPLAPIKKHFCKPNIPTPHWYSLQQESIRKNKMPYLKNYSAGAWERPQRYLLDLQSP